MGRHEGSIRRHGGADGAPQFPIPYHYKMRNAWIPYTEQWILSTLQDADSRFPDLWVGEEPEEDPLKRKW